MSKKELRELDAWIAAHVMGYEKCPMGWKDKGLLICDFEHWNPTSDSAAAMQVLEKCCETQPVRVWKTADCRWCVCATGMMMFASSETLALSICKFAKKIFSK